MKSRFSSILPLRKRARICARLVRGAAILALSLTCGSAQDARPQTKEDIARQADLRRQLIAEISGTATIKGAAFSAAKEAYAKALAESQNLFTANHRAAAAAFSAALRAGSVPSDAAHVAAIVTGFPAAVAVIKDRSFTIAIAQDSYAVALADTADTTTVANNPVLRDSSGNLAAIIAVIISGITMAAEATGNSAEVGAITDDVTNGIITAARAAGYSPAEINFVFRTRVGRAAYAAAESTRASSLAARANANTANAAAAAAAFHAAIATRSRAGYASNAAYAAAAAYAASNWAAYLAYSAVVGANPAPNVDIIRDAAIAESITAGITAETEGAGYSYPAAVTAVSEAISAGIYFAARAAGYSEEAAKRVASAKDRGTAVVAAVTVALAAGSRVDAVEIVRDAVAAAPAAVLEIFAVAAAAAPGSRYYIGQAVLKALPDESKQAKAVRDALSEMDKVQMAPGGPRPPQFSIKLSSSEGDGTATTPVLPSVGELSPDGKYVEVGILYATDRKPLMPLDKWNDGLKSKGSKYVYFGPEPDYQREAERHQMHYGVCTVTVPVTHKETKLERPKWFKRESKEKHFTISRISELDRDGMEKEITEKAGPGKDAFIFIHGFNVSFNDAAMRAAQLAYDFDFMGAPILYSWSSAGEATFSGYNHDQDNVRATEDHLLAFIDRVVRRAQVKKIHVVAHSMGNRALIAVLKRLADRGEQKIFGEVVLAAPDVPLGDFYAPVAKRVLPLADRISLYASSDDKALQLSMKASKHARLGLSGKDLFVVQGIDTIDATGVDTNLLSLSHSYFADARVVLDDLAALLIGRTPAGEAPRALAKKTNPANVDYWAVKR